MIVHFLKEDALETLRTNLHDNLKHYAEPTNKWIYDYFGDENPFGEFKTEFPDFKLSFDESKTAGENEVNNAILLYRSMKLLSDTQATDERLWSGICHSDLYSYFNTRWKYNDVSNIKEKSLYSRYFFAHNKKRSLMTNCLSRLWWLGRLTIDETQPDPLKLIKYFIYDFAQKSLVIFSSNFTNNYHILSGLINALIYLDKIGYCINHLSKDMVYKEAAKYLNVFGGTCILDYFSSGEISEKVINHMKSLPGAQFDA